VGVSFELAARTSEGEAMSKMRRMVFLFLTEQYQSLINLIGCLPILLPNAGAENSTKWNSNRFELWQKLAIPTIQ
jgi:hypothetical protein